MEVCARLAMPSASDVVEHHERFHWQGGVAAVHCGIGGEEGLLDDPDAAPPGAGLQLGDGAEAGGRGGVVRGAEVGAVEIADEGHGEVACGRLWAEPDGGVGGGLVDLAHELDLVGLFVVVGLVDAQGVDPEGGRGGANRGAEVLQGGVEVAGDGVGGLVVESDGEAVRGVAPDVGERRVGGLVGEVDDVAGADEGVAAGAGEDVEEADLVFGQVDVLALVGGGGGAFEFVNLLYLLHAQVGDYIGE